MIAAQVRTYSTSRSSVNETKTDAAEQWDLHVHFEHGQKEKRRATVQGIAIGLAENCVEETRKRKQVAVNRRKTLQYP